MTSISEDDGAKDMCPICRTDRYLSPNMTFLINPECYHKICESCVDRIFALGPAPCPYPNCSKILRRNRFKKQIFDDIAIEREVDIRKRVTGIYNKTEEDFDTLKEFNAYLENIETIVYNLTNNLDAQKTEADLVAFEKDNKTVILEKQMKESQKNADLVQYEEAKAKWKQEKLKIQQNMEMEDVQFQKQQKQELLDQLSVSGNNTEEIIQKANNMLLKRNSNRKRQLQQINRQLDQQFESSLPGAVKKEEGPKTPFTPFIGDRDLQKKYELPTIPEDYDMESKSGGYYDPFAGNLAKNKEFLGAGWRVNQVFERALDEAFMGLSCFIEEEKGKEEVIENVSIKA